MTLHACPRCGGTEVAYDYLAALTIGFEQGTPVALNLGGVTDGAPDQLYCPECGEVPVAELSEAQCAQLAEDARAFGDRVRHDWRPGWMATGIDLRSGR